MANTSPPTETSKASENKSEVKPVTTPENLRKAAGVGGGDQGIDSGSDTNVSVPDRLRDASGLDVLPKPGTVNQEARRIESEANAGGPVRVYQQSDMTLPDGTKSNGMTFTKNGQEFFAQTEGTNKQIFAVNRENGLPVLTPAVPGVKVETAKVNEVATPAVLTQLGVNPVVKPLETLPGGTLPTEGQLRRDQNAAVLTGQGDKVQLAQLGDLAQARVIAAQTDVRSTVVTPDVKPVTVNNNGLPVLDGKAPVLPGTSTEVRTTLPTLDGKGGLIQPEVRNPTVIATPGGNPILGANTPEVRLPVLGDNKGATVPVPAVDVTRSIVTNPGDGKPLVVDARAFAALPPDKQAVALQQIADAQSKIALGNVDRAVQIQQQVQQQTQLPLDKPVRVEPLVTPRVDLLNPIPGANNNIPGQIPGQIRVDMKPGELPGGKPAEFKPAEIVPGVKPAEFKPAEVKPLEVMKPAEIKPTDIKPVEAKLPEVKPFEAKPAEVKLPDVKPVDLKSPDGRPLDAAKPIDPAIAAQLAAIVKAGDATAMAGRVLVDASGQPMKGPDGQPLRVADLLAAQKAAELAGGLKVADSALTGKPGEGLKLGDKAVAVAGDLTGAKLAGEVVARGTKDGVTLPGAADIAKNPLLTADGKLVDAKALEVKLGPDGKPIVDAKLADIKLGPDGKPIVDAKLAGLDGLKPLVELKPGVLDQGKVETKAIETVRAESAYQAARQPLPEALAGIAKDMVRPDGTLAPKSELAGKVEPGRPETQAQKVEAALAAQQNMRLDADKTGDKNADKNAQTVRVEQTLGHNDKLDPSAQNKGDKEGAKTAGDTASSAAKFDELIDKAKKQREEDRLDEEELQNSRNAMMMALLAQKKQQQEQEEKEFQLRNEDSKNKGEDKRRRYVVKEKETLESIAKKQLRDVRLAALLYEINKHMLPVRMEKGKQVVDPRPGTAIWLPAEYEIKEFRGRLYAAPKQDAAVSKFATPEEELAQRFGSGWEGNTTRTSVADGMMGSAVAKSQARRENIEKILGPMAKKENDSQRIRYIVRLTDSIESVAQKHPALKDVTLWPLLASLNELTTDIDDSGKPLAELRRGMVLDIPLPSEIEQYRSFDDDYEESAETAPSADVDWKATVQVPVQSSTSSAPVHHREAAAADQFASAQSVSSVNNAAPSAVPASSAVPLSAVQSSAGLMPPVPTNPAAAGTPKSSPVAPTVIEPGPASRSSAEPAVTPAVAPAPLASPVPAPAALSAAAAPQNQPVQQPLQQQVQQPVQQPLQPQQPLQQQVQQPVQPQQPVQQSVQQSVQQPVQPQVQAQAQPPVQHSGNAPQPFQAPPLPAGAARPNPSNTFNSLLAVGGQANIQNAALAASQAQTGGQVPGQMSQQQPQAQLEPQPQPSSQTETNPVLNAVPGAGRTAMSALDMPPINAGDRFIWQLDPSVRLVKSTMKWDPAVGVFRSQLELLLEDTWYPVIFYEVFPHMAVRHEYMGGSRKKSVKMDLPPTPAQELADNDLVNNWQRYCHNFVSQMNGPRTGPTTQV